MGILMGVARKLNSTESAHHSAGRKAEDVSALEEEHTARRNGGAGGATPRIGGAGVSPASGVRGCPP